MKVCRMCEAVLESGVNWIPSDERKHSLRCAICSNKKAAEYRAANREKTRAADKKWRENNPDKVKEKGKKWLAENHDKHAARQREYRNRDVDAYNNWQRERSDKCVAQRLLAAAKTRANKKGFDFNIEIDDIIIPEICPILNIRLERGTRENKDFAPSIDRIDSSKGYVKGNVHVVSWKANRLKSNASFEEIALLFEWFSKRYDRQ